MDNYSLIHLSDAVLLRELAVLVARDRLTTAELLAHIAEVDARRLYVPAGFASMHVYCVEELRLSEDAASKRIQAARAARRFPVLFTALAEGRIHLSGVWLLAPHLTHENAGELIEAATHRRKAEIEAILARRFPPPETPALVRAITSPVSLQHALGHVGNGASTPSGFFQNPPAPLGDEVSEGRTPEEHALGHVESSLDVAPPAPERYLLKLTIGKSTHDKLRYAQALLSHAVPTGDVAQVLDRALDTLIAKLEKRKVGGVTNTRANGNGHGPLPQRTSPRARYIPAHIRRAVWERDQGRCTFLSASGHRCNERRFLEFDHLNPVARGGRATVGGLRLRCRAHNQYEAERTFGAGFMTRKRQEARLAAAAARVSAMEAQAHTAETETTQDVIAGLRSLGFRADEARRAAELSSPTGATLEDRMLAALQLLGRRSIRAQSCVSRE